MPYYPEPSPDSGHHYNPETYWPHFVATYAGISLRDVFFLDLIDYLYLRREAYIIELSKTESGREYLEKCWTYEQTEPDREGLRKLREKMGRVK